MADKIYPEEQRPKSGKYRNWTQNLKRQRQLIYVSSVGKLGNDQILITQHPKEKVIGFRQKVKQLVLSVIKTETSVHFPFEM